MSKVVGEIPVAHSNGIIVAQNGSLERKGLASRLTPLGVEPQMNGVKPHMNDCVFALLLTSMTFSFVS